MEMDYNLRKLTKFFKFFLCIQSSRSTVSIFSFHCLQIFRGKVNRHYQSEEIFSSDHN